LVEHCLEHQKKISIEEILNISTLAKEFGILSNKILRHVAKHFQEIKSMTPNQLSLFTMIYTSDEMRAAFEINREGSQLEKLEFYLIKNLELFNPTEFAMICNTIRPDRSDQNAIKFDQLLENASSNVMSWFSGDDLTSLVDIQNIA
jgi:transposase-like protein